MLLALTQMLGGVLRGHSQWPISKTEGLGKPEPYLGISMTQEGNVPFGSCRQNLERE